MSEPNDRHDDSVAEELLAALREETPTPADDLSDRTIRRVQDLLSARDMIDFATIVFLLQFIAPVLDLVAAMLGHELPDDSRRNDGD